MNSHCLVLFLRVLKASTPLHDITCHLAHRAGLEETEVVAARFAQRRVEDEDHVSFLEVVPPRYRSPDRYDVATHLVCDHDVFESHILWT